MNTEVELITRFIILFLFSQFIFCHIFEKTYSVCFINYYTVLASLDFKTLKEPKMINLFSKLRFSILYFFYAFEIHRPNVNSVLQSSLNWNKTISVINVLCSYCPLYAVLCHSTLVSNLLSTYPISTPTCRARLCQREHVLSCYVLSCPVSHLRGGSTHQ